MGRTRLVHYAASIALICSPAVAQEATLADMASTDWSNAKASDYENQWIYLGPLARGGHIDVEAAAYIRQRQAPELMPRLWMRSDYRNDKTTTARTALSFYRFDCAGKRYATLHMTYYGADGRSLSDYDSQYDFWQFVAPGSYLSIAMRYWCPAP